MTATSIRTRNSATTTTSRSTTPATPRTTKATRKPKPKGTFPLFQHRNGQWAKKVNGKLYYFGTDKDAALERWKAEMDHIMAGRPVPRSDGTPQLAELGNVFHADCMQRVASGTLAKRSADEYERTIARMVDVFGRDSRPQHWTPMDFARLAEAFAQPVDRKTAIRGGIKGPSVTRRSAVTVAGDIRRAKAFLNWCADSELIPPPRYGRNFQPLSQREQRIIRSKTGRRDLAADDLRKILEHCSVWYKPIVMLGINGAIGNLDIAEMRLEQYDGEWLDLPAVKLVRRAASGYGPKHERPSTHTWRFGATVAIGSSIPDWAITGTATPTTQSVQHSRRHVRRLVWGVARSTTCAAHSQPWPARRKTSQQ